MLKKTSPKLAKNEIKNCIVNIFCMRWTVSKWIVRVDQMTMHRSSILFYFFSLPQCIWLTDVEKRWGKGIRSGYRSAPHPIVTDYRTGYIRSHLRSPSGRVRWPNHCPKDLQLAITKAIITKWSIAMRIIKTINSIDPIWQLWLWPTMIM